MADESYEVLPPLADLMGLEGVYKEFFFWEVHNMWFGM